VRQIFSLFHELAHLLLGENDVTRGISRGSGKIETFCDQFAAEFLVPSDDLETRLNFSTFDDDAIQELADYYKVSRPVILIKLVNRGIHTENNYWQKINQWTKEHESRMKKREDSNTPSGGSYYNALATYLGYRFMELAFGKYRQGHCSVEQLAEHLNVKVKHLPQLEDRLLRKALR
jgi:Zn-dependent peptidase ImmA (M78 family)